MLSLQIEPQTRMQSPSALSDRDLTADLDDLIDGQAEEVADMDGVAFHHGEDALLPGRKAVAAIAVDHRFVSDEVGDVVYIDGATKRLAGRKQLRNVRPLHEAEASFR